MRNRGITLPELLISVGILMTLFGITFVSLLRSQRVSVQRSTVDTLLTDIRDQQNKAMAQDTKAATSPSDYGIRLTSTNYTMFKGSTYNASDANNFTVTLDTSVQLVSITWPSSVIVFKSGSGEVNNFVGTTNTFQVRDLTNSQNLTITLNKYGVTSD